MGFLEQFPPLSACCLCLSDLRLGCILTAIYLILETTSQIVGKCIYLIYDNPDNDGKYSIHVHHIFLHEIHVEYYFIQNK